MAFCNEINRLPPVHRCTAMTPPDLWPCRWTPATPTWQAWTIQPAIYHLVRLRKCPPRPAINPQQSHCCPRSRGHLLPHHLYVDSSAEGVASSPQSVGRPDDLLISSTTTSSEIGTAGSGSSSSSSKELGQDPLVQRRKSTRGGQRRSP